MDNELKKQIEKYGEEKLHFVSYYKYTFYYENEKVEVWAGGDSSDIYRSDLRAVMTLKELAYECGTEYMEIKEVNNLLPEKENK